MEWGSTRRYSRSSILVIKTPALDRFFPLRQQDPPNQAKKQKT